jgi:hypothetical protein
MRDTAAPVLDVFYQLHYRLIKYIRGQLSAPDPNFFVFAFRAVYASAAQWNQTSDMCIVSIQITVFR